MRFFGIIFGLLLLCSILGITNNEAYGLWMAKSPEQLLEESLVILVGNVTSIDVIETIQTTEIVGDFSEDTIPYDKPFSAKMIWENGDSKAFEITYVSKMDKLTIDVEEYLKNIAFRNNSTVTIMAPNNHGAPILHHEIKSDFKLGDRVLLYITDKTIRYDMYSLESFVMPEQCDSRDVSTQERFGMHSGGLFFKQDNVSINKYVIENKPIQLDYRIDTKTLDGKRFDIPLNITKIDVSPPVLIFNGTLISESQPCEWVTTSQMEIDLESGEYLANYLPSNKESNLEKVRAVFFDVKSDTFLDSQMSPFKQIKNGINPVDITCKEGLELVYKKVDDTSACVTLTTEIELVIRGWAVDHRLLLGCIGEHVSKCYPDDPQEYRQALYKYYFGSEEGLPSSDAFDFDVLRTLNACTDKPWICYGEFDNGTKMRISCDYPLHGCGVRSFDNYVEVENEN